MARGIPVDKAKVLESLRRTKSISQTALELNISYSSVARINKRLGLIQLSKAGYPIKFSSCLTEPLTSKETMYQELQNLKKENLELIGQLKLLREYKLRLQNRLEACSLKAEKLDETIMRLKLNKSGLEAFCGD